MFKALVFTAMLVGALPSSASCPIAEALIDQLGVSFSGFTKPISRVAQPAAAEATKDLVVVQLPNRKGYVPDGFFHSALIDRDNKRAWIHRTGGFLSVSEWYGPVDLPEIDLEGCATERR
jgi:hypothetical protein